MVHPHKDPLWQKTTRDLHGCANVWATARGWKAVHYARWIRWRLATRALVSSTKELHPRDFAAVWDLYQAMHFEAGAAVALLWPGIRPRPALSVAIDAWMFWRPEHTAPALEETCRFCGARVAFVELRPVGRPIALDLNQEPHTQTCEQVRLWKQTSYNRSKSSTKPRAQF